MRSKAGNRAPAWLGEARPPAMVGKLSSTKPACSFRRLVSSSSTCEGGAEVLVKVGGWGGVVKGWGKCARARARARVRVRA